MRRWCCLPLLAAVSLGCQRTRPAEAAQKPEPPPATASRSPLPAEPPHPTVSSPKVTPLAVCQARGKDPLAAARKLYDEGRYDEALSCAAQACALSPEEPQAHSERGAALTALRRYDEAKLAYARGLAIDPDHRDSLLGAAHLFAVALPSGREHDELASLYAERGLGLAEDQRDDELIAQFALLSAMAFNDLGQAKDALERADLVLKLRKGDPEARYERAVALFELCRFDEAKAAFQGMLQDSQRSAHAHHHLGLILEREGKLEQAERHFAAAHRLDAEDFPAPQLLSPEEFSQEVKKAVAALPADMRKDLANVPVATEDVPRADDLLSGEPPLSPAILGLFRGPPLKERCPPAANGEPCRSVALYRRNLARAVRSKEELIEQIRVTLLHEVGHLRGEDDFELAARGLE